MSAQLKVDLSGFLSIGEKRKLLNRFISRVDESEVDKILKECEGLSSIQYDLLKLSLADKFHRSDLIIDLLHNGEESIINAAVSKRWMYEGETDSFNDIFFLNILFPKVSYICRQKLLYRIGRYVQNEEKADEIWNDVQQRYGFNVAFPVLQACSKLKIKSVIETRKVNLSGRQLVQILQKHPDVGLEYFKNHYAHDSCSNPYRSPVYYIYLNRPDDFLDLCMNHPNKIKYFKIGRSGSTKIIRNYRAKVLENPTKFISTLKFDRIRREFSTEEFQMLFESMLATQPLHRITESTWRWVNTVPIDERINMIIHAYSKLFHINLDDHPDYIDTDYIVLLPDEKRLSAIQWKIDNEATSYRSFKKISFYIDEKKFGWIVFKPISHSVPELRKLLLIEQDVRFRACLSKYLILTCYINDDLSQFLNVLTLLGKRSRNDQCEVRNEIFETIYSIMKEMEFSKEHWDAIIEMIQVSIVFKDKAYYTDRSKESIVEKCLAFHLASKLPLNNLVGMHIKWKIQTNSISWTNSSIKSAEDRRSILELYVNELENLQLANNLCSYNGDFLGSVQFNKFIVELVEAICEFNKTLARTSQGVEPILISSHQWLRNNFEQIAKDEEDRVNKNCSSRNSGYSWHFAEQLVKIIQNLRREQKLSLDAFNGIEDLMEKILHCSPRNSILMHFLRKNPSVLIQSWSTTLSEILKSKQSSIFLRKLKSSDYSTLIDQSIRICSEIILSEMEKENSRVEIKQKCNAVQVLSVLSETSDFLSFAAQFYPTETKVDVSAKKSEKDYEIKETFAKSLINVIVPHLSFPALEKFCVGDYLKLVVGSFYSLTDRAPADKSLNFLRHKVVNSPVSLQKHIIRQYFNISTVEDKSRILNEINSTNVSIRHEIFRQANKLFRSSPSQETWTMLKTIIEMTSEDDAPTVLYLHQTPKFETCPLEYVSDYTQTCLLVLRKIDADKVDNFLSHLVTVIDQISEEILDDIILYKIEDRVSFNSGFCLTYLQSSASMSVLEHRLSNMWSLLQNSIRNGWHQKIRFDYPTRSLVFSFISSLCLVQIKDASEAWLKHHIFQTLLGKFTTESNTKFFREMLYLELALMLAKEVNKGEIERLRSFGRNLARFTDSLVEIYGAAIIYILKDEFIHFVSMYFSEEFQANKGVIVELIDGILEMSKSRQNQIIAITFLKNVNPGKPEIFEKINKFLKESNDIVAQIYYGYSNL